MSRGRQDDEDFWKLSHKGTDTEEAVMSVEAKIKQRETQVLSQLFESHLEETVGNGRNVFIAYDTPGNV